MSCDIEHNVFLTRFDLNDEHGFFFFLTSSVADQKPCAAPWLRTIRRRRERRDKPRLLRRHRLGETKPQRTRSAFQAEDCKSRKGRKVGCVTDIYFSRALFCFFFVASRQKTPEDVNNFDPDFTQEEPTLTPIDDPVIPSINQEEFRNFSFISPELLEL